MRMELAHMPSSLLDCSCTVCRRYGALWAYPMPGEVKVVLGADATDIYLWGDKGLEFHRCKQCGCVMHMTAVDANPPRIYGINARMIPTLDPATATVRQIDNGHTGIFWTQSAEPPIPGHHPKMPPPGPDDWR
ncbi:MAG TPA: hypothetical protein VK509_07050 [Polyangiales bacterium]|nr:hypothetical protein [Polyangiales bacterium]